MDVIKINEEIRQIMAKVGHLLAEQEKASSNIEDQLKAKIKTLNVELDEKIGKIKEMTTALDEKNRIILVQEEMIATYEQALKQKEEIISSNQQALTQKDLIIIEKNDLLLQKEIIINQCEDLVNEKEVAVTRLNKDLTLQIAEISKLNEITNQLDVKTAGLGVQIHNLDDMNSHLRKQLSLNHRNAETRCHILESQISSMKGNICSLESDLLDFIINDSCITGPLIVCDDNAKSQPKCWSPANSNDVLIAGISNELLKMMDADSMKAAANLKITPRKDVKKMYKQPMPSSAKSKHLTSNRKEIKFVGLTSLSYY